MGNRNNRLGIFNHVQTFTCSEEEGGNLILITDAALGEYVKAELGHLYDEDIEEMALAIKGDDTDSNCDPYGNTYSVSAGESDGMDCDQITGGSGTPGGRTRRTQTRAGRQGCPKKISGDNPASEADETRAYRLQRYKNYRDRKRANETPEERAKRHERYRIYREKKRSCPIEREIMLSKQRERFHRKMANETPEQKALRLERGKRNLANLTPEQKERRREQKRNQFRRKMANETPEQAEKRRERARERCRLRKESGLVRQRKYLIKERMTRKETALIIKEEPKW